MTLVELNVVSIKLKSRAHGGPASMPVTAFSVFLQSWFLENNNKITKVALLNTLNIIVPHRFSKEAVMTPWSCNILSIIFRTAIPLFFHSCFFSTFPPFFEAFFPKCSHNTTVSKQIRSDDHDTFALIFIKSLTSFFFFFHRLIVE